MTDATKTSITSKIWKIATGSAAVMTLLLSALLFSSYLQNRDLATQRAALSKQINDPSTGYIAQLAQAKTNVETLKVVVDQQNVAYEKLSVESKARLAEAERRLALAQGETRKMEAKLAGFLSTGPKGTSLEDRIRDIDERAMKEFVE